MLSSKRNYDWSGRKTKKFDSESAKYIMRKLHQKLTNVATPTEWDHAATPSKNFSSAQAYGKAVSQLKKSLLKSLRKKVAFVKSVCLRNVLLSTLLKNLHEWQRQHVRISILFLLQSMPLKWEKWKFTMPKAIPDTQLHMAYTMLVLIQQCSWRSTIAVP